MLRRVLRHHRLENEQWPNWHGLLPSCTRLGCVCCATAPARFSSSAAPGEAPPEHETPVHARQDPSEPIKLALVASNSLQVEQIHVTSRRSSDQRSRVHAGCVCVNRCQRRVGSTQQAHTQWKSSTDWPSATRRACARAPRSQ